MTTDKIQSTQIAVQQQRNITEQVLSKIETFKQAGELRLPADYSPENALKAAYLVLLETKTSDKRPVMEACTKESIANSLLKMVVWGLSPLKKQCDFIAYGDKLSCDPEYTGNIALAIRYGGLKYHKANAIFAGDDFKFEVGVTRIKVDEAIKYSRVNIDGKVAPGKYLDLIKSLGNCCMNFKNTEEQE